MNMPANKPARNWSVYSLRFTIVLMCLFFFLYSRIAPRFQERIMRGETMGTTYTIRLANCTVGERMFRELQTVVDRRLNEINQQMSIYRPDSEISRLNQVDDSSPVKLAPDLARVLRFALELAEKTGGAFDPTVAPLVNLWGFGPDGRRLVPPSDAEVAAAKEQVGYRHAVMASLDRVQKKTPALQFDLGALAKGFAVDNVSQLLFNLGYTNHLVEIGGEIRATGLNQKRQKWRIGIQKPNYASLPGEELEGVVSLSDRAMATSGDYQIFFEDAEGTVYAHIIDPRTGYPVGHALASATVLAYACMPADALATAVYVLGPEEGLALIEAWDGAEVLMALRNPDGTFEHIMSSGFFKMASFEAP